MNAAAVAVRPGAGRREAARTSAAAGGESLILRGLAFAALAGLGAGEWGGLLSAPPVGRSAAVVTIAAAAGFAIASTSRIPLAAPVRTLARCVLVLAAAAAALIAIGVPTRLLAPHGWCALHGDIQRGLAGASSTGWPYQSGDHWVRLTLLLGIPILVVPAAALAFWPARRAAPVLRAAALVLLLVLYALPATEVQAGAPIGRGLILLALVGAWLWLPRLRRRDLAAAGFALALAAAAALPVSAALERHEAWIDYSGWRIAAGTGDGRSFDWDQRYGPLAWSRQGLTMLTVRAPHPHYWKAETLDRFDGLRWIHSDAGRNSDPTAELPPARNPRWNEDIRFTVRNLRSDVLIAAGTVYAVDTDKLVTGSADGTIRVIDGPLATDDTYVAHAYVPDPTAAQMRAAPRTFPTQFLSYTYFELPARGASALTMGPPRPDAPNVDPSTVSAPSPGSEPGADPAVRRMILESPYASTYRLARRLAAGQRTQYDVVQSVQRYFRHGFTYDEHPPLRRYPLPAFLFRDRIGYCQQFSGAMALLLRMDGIPARVAAGFAPGQRDPSTKDYRVRDLDAHSWVEVWFTGIGWVPFDPTPPLAPALAQASGRGAPSAAVGGHDTGATGAKQRAVGSAGAAQSGGQSGWWRIALVLAGVAALGLAALWLVTVLRAHRVRGGDPALVELRRALERLGYDVPPATTLLGLERRLRTATGPAAAAYVHALRECRFAGRRSSVPSPRDRRRFRRALSAGRGPIVRLRALLALPPAPLLRFPHAPLMGD